jgi:hypothetical protein
VKICSYCGRENAERHECCSECGAELLAAQVDLSILAEQSAGAEDCVFCGVEISALQKRCASCGNERLAADHPTEDLFQADPEAEELPPFELEYELDHDLSHPQWEKFWQLVNARLPRTSLDAAYRRAARKWLQQLREDLGGTYRCYETKNFLFLGAEGRRVSDALLTYAEKSQEVIAAQIGRLAPRDVYGKHVLLVLSDADDYYTYISHFYRDGTHNTSSGVFITAGGYSHIAMPFHFVYSAKAVITHELVHNNLFHLPIPTWLNEGLAQRVEGIVVGRASGLDREMAQRHREFWDEESLQHFWAGQSFHEPGESAELSYHLGLLLVESLIASGAAFLDFVAEADWRDGGQDAAVRILDQDLGAVVGGLLGEGNWRPNRKRIADLLLTGIPKKD